MISKSMDTMIRQLKFPERMDDACLLVRIVLFLCLTTLTQYVSAFDLTILHTNDIHSRIEEMNKYNGRCPPTEAEQGKCYGGVARLKSKIDEIRAQYPNSILLDGGDQYQGTLFFYVYGGQIMSHFMNALGYDAMGLGNHEFDGGSSGLMPFVDNATFNILSCNIDTTMTPDLKGIRKSVVINTPGRDVGIIGYTTRNTATISNPGRITFSDEIESIQKEVDILIAQGVNIIIALGHAGYDKDMEIAEKVRGLDIVVGGHTNTFLYTGDAPAHEEPMGLYPTVVKGPNGRDVLVVQDYAYGKYLGFLQVDFDYDGVVTAWKGNPILMDNTVPKDPGISKMIAGYLPQVESVKSQKVGQTLVHLQGDRTVCRIKECNLGNMVADSMVRQNLRYSDSVKWNHVAIALTNSGGIRSSIPKGAIMASDVLSVCPFGNTVDIVDLSGRVLWDVLEHSASGWVATGELNGAFLQISGMRIVYDMRREAGDRVAEVYIRCTACDIPEFEPIDMTKTYTVLVSSFMVGGGDGYAMIKNNVKNAHTIGDLDSQLLLDYITENSPLSQGLDGRIQFLQDIEKNQHCAGKNASYVVKASLLCVLTSLVTVTIFLF